MGLERDVAIRVNKAEHFLVCRQHPNHSHQFLVVFHKVDWRGKKAHRKLSHLKQSCCQDFPTNPIRQTHPHTTCVALLSVCHTVSLETKTNLPFPSLFLIKHPCQQGMPQPWQEQCREFLSPFLLIQVCHPKRLSWQFKQKEHSLSISPLSQKEKQETRSALALPTQDCLVIKTLPVAMFLIEKSIHTLTSWLQIQPVVK